VSIRRSGNSEQRTHKRTSKFPTAATGEIAAKTNRKLSCFHDVDAEILNHVSCHMTTTIRIDGRGNQHKVLQHHQEFGVFRWTDILQFIPSRLASSLS
jgi:hypothetical protein